MSTKSKCEFAASKILALLNNRGLKPAEKKLVKRFSGSPNIGEETPDLITKFECSLKEFRTAEVQFEFFEFGFFEKRYELKIIFELFKKGTFLGIGKESKKFEFRLNPYEFIDDQLIVKDEEALQKALDSYLKTMGFPSD